MLHTFLKFIFTSALSIFFKEYKVVNKTDIPEEGPLIVVSNHPSTFMDPIIVSNLLKQDAHFIGKGTLFNSVLKNWFMRNIVKAIPIYRRQDNAGKAQNNEAIFEQCFQFLEEKGTLIIFPEGTSIHERKLQDIKTGTARIALGAEARNNFNLGVRILSVGINYSDAPSFRSDVWVNVEELIHVKDYQAAYEKDDRQAVNLLTDKIQKNLENNLIIADDEQEDQFIKNVEAIYKNELISALNLDPKLHAFTLTKGIQEAVNHFEDLDETWLEALQEKVADYTRRLSNNNLEDKFLARDKNQESNIFSDSLLRLFFLVLGLPLYLYGLLTNYLPYHLPQAIAESLTKDEEYMGPIKMTAGIFTFSVFYSVLVYLFQRFIAHGDWWWTVFFALSLPIAGFFALLYAQRYNNLITHGRLIALFYSQPALIGELLAERKAIIKELDWAKEQYLKEAITLQ